jgi:phospholipase C
MLIVTWDEHGGFYDHVPPEASVPPDEHTAAFDFASYGLRVPAVIVSPLVPKGTISRQTYDHTSVLATAKQLFNLPAFLTRRDAGATTLLPLASLASPRDDAPLTVPRPPSQAFLALQEPIATQAPNDLQLDLLTLARHLDPAVSITDVLAPVPPTEEQAAREAQAHGAHFAQFA